MLVCQLAKLAGTVHTVLLLDYLLRSHQIRFERLYNEY
jgi:hypothetical protein